MHRALKRLGELPGMADIKDQVEQVIQFNKISKLRKQQGLKAEPQSNHMVFTGNPGTGKTTAARLIGEAFSSLGILKGRTSEEIPFVEVHHSDVTSSLVGEAEKTIKKKFNLARGGVIFIDEVYAFIDGKSNHKSDDKVVAAIVQLMEDMRDEVVVIVAGYSKETDKFLDSNPGLRSRFSNIVNFPDYSVPDMISIALNMLSERDYQAEADYISILANRLWVEKSEKGFGNARTVRNIVEQSIRMHSVRVAQIFSPNRTDLTLLTKHDIASNVQKRLSEKEILFKALKDIQSRLLDIDLREAISGKTTVEDSINRKV